MKKYRVNRSGGWPIEYTRFALGEEFESDSTADAKAVEHGYLVEVVEEVAPKKSTKKDAQAE